MVEQKKPLHRRSRLEPSRSMPMNARRLLPTGTSPNNTSTPRPSRSVVHLPRRPQRTYSGKNSNMNPYRDQPTIRSIQSPTRSGKSSIQAMANSVEQRRGSEPMLKFNGHHSSSFLEEPVVSLSCAEECLLGNDKRRRTTSSYGILKSLFKAIGLMTFGFGTGYVYSNQMHVVETVQESLAPWGYSPADPVIQALLQHNDHKDVIQDIKNIKFPGRTPQEEPKLDFTEAPLKKADKKELNIHQKDSIVKMEENQQPSQDDQDTHMSPPVHPPDISPNDVKPDSHFRHSQVRLRGKPEQPQLSATPPPKAADWDPTEEKLVHVVNKSARKIRLFWIPSTTASTNDWVPMSDPFIDDGMEFYLHARPTHQFAIKEEPYQGDASLEFTVLNQEQQKVMVYDNWKLEVLDETAVEKAEEQPLIHENPKEQHAPPQYMTREQNSAEYWEQQRQQQQLEQENNENGVVSGGGQQQEERREEVPQQQQDNPQQVQVQQQEQEQVQQQVQQEIQQQQEVHHKHGDNQQQSL